MVQTDVPPDRHTIRVQVPRNTELAPAPLNQSYDGLLVRHASAWWS